jgi:peptidoglycan/xylan/chitin deacetylase (PgdA/CDA1 family)
VTGSLILCYHGVSDRWDDALAVTATRLRDEVALLLSRGYRATTFTRAVLSAPPRSFAVTFDDAFASVGRLALPVLAALDVPATVFVPTDHVSRARPMRWTGIEHWHGTPHEDELTPLTWDQLGELADVGWEIGSHTCSHPRLTELDDDWLEDELERSRAVCEERLGRPCRSLAYPYGAHDRRVMAAAARAGYWAAAGLPARGEGVADAASPFSVPRVGVYRRDGHLRFRLKVARARVVTA